MNNEKIKEELKVLVEILKFLLMVLLAIGTGIKS
jgi:hypothetical protein